jgi:hypothetical protein
MESILRTYSKGFTMKGKLLWLSVGQSIIQLTADHSDREDQMKGNNDLQQRVSPIFGNGLGG